MSRIIDILAKILSVMLYPLFIPTYGIALFCFAFSVQVSPLPIVWAIVAVAGTFVLTCLLPITSIWILMRRGEVNDMYIENAQERTMPYLYAILGFSFWSYLLIAILHAPSFINCVGVGATVALALVALINRKWKISAHLTGFGGLVGGWMSYCLGIGAVPAWGSLALWLGISLVLMYARLRLKAHTSAQVSAGWLLGIACTFLPYCIICYAA